MKLKLYDKVQEIWKDIARDAKIEALEFELEVHKRIFTIFQVGDYYYFVFDVTSGEFEFISPEISKVLGYNAETLSVSTFFSSIHPEDQPYFVNFENTVNHFYRQFPVEKYKKFKIRYDFRIKNSKGKYVRLLHQMVVLQHDNKGNITRSLGIHTDISDLKTTGSPVLSFIGLDGEPSYINIDVEEVFTPVREIFSKREKEVLKYLAEGKSSPEIACILNISRLTIDTHRKNILKKTGASSTAELLMKSVKEGWI
jgi:DNA-binding CsgD family transcriptional regulator